MMVTEEKWVALTSDLPFNVDDGMFHRLLSMRDREKPVCFSKRIEQCAAHFVAHHKIHACRIAIVEPDVDDAAPHIAPSLAKKYYLPMISPRSAAQWMAERPCEDNEGKDALRTEAAAAVEKNDISSDLAARCLKERLAAYDCRNQGYILIGFPKDAQSLDCIFYDKEVTENSDEIEEKKSHLEHYDLKYCSVFERICKKNLTAHGQNTRERMTARLSRQSLVRMRR